MTAVPLVGLTLVTVSGTNGTAVILPGSTNVLFTPATNFNGTATIGYSISDGQGGTASALITVTMSAAQDPPVAVNDFTNTVEDVSVTIQPLANDSDPDGDPLTITTVNPTNGTAVILPDSTNVLFTPATNFVGTATIGYSISDGQGGTASALITVTVTSGVNDPPMAVNDFTNTVEDVSVTIQPLANDSDPDGDPLTITSVSPTNGTAIILPGSTNVLFTPATNLFGTATIGYSISDGQGGTASALITVTMSAVQDPPVAVNDFTNTVEDVSVTIQPLANDSDVDGDPLTITSVSPTNGTAVILPGSTNVLFTPATNFNGTATIGYSISDGQGGTASALITVTVTSGVNDPPVAVNDFTNTVEDVSVTIQPLANDSDPDGDPLTITSVSPTNGTASIAGTNVVFTPATNFFGTATIGYTISDGRGGTASALITVTVTAGAENDPPEALNDFTNTVEDVAVTIQPLVNDNDPDGDTLTITTVSPTNGTASIAGPNVVFLPATNFTGTATIGYTISDGNGGSASALITVTVTSGGPNDPPVAVNDFTNTVEEVAVTIQPLDNDSDPDGDPLTITTVSPTNGTALISGPNVVFTPATNISDTAPIGYNISDGNGGTASALITVTVTSGGPNQPPVAANDSTNTLADV